MPRDKPAAGPGPQTYDELRQVLQDRVESFAPGQQRIARLLLTDPQGTAFRTIGQTAELAGVHQSSLVRFASTLGLKGYPSLVALCRDRLAAEAHLVSRFLNAERHHDSGQLLQETVGHEQENLVRTFTRITSQQWDETVNLVSAADRVHVMGLRKCLPVAQLLTYLLSLVRPDVRLVAPVTGMLVDDLRALRPGEVFIAVSLYRYTSDTVTALDYARDAGLHTVALTDSAASPLAKSADIHYIVDCDGVTILKSISAFISLVQALATAVGIRNGTRSRDELLTDERILDQFSVYDD
ncbi:MurR/RpiR family transcriptional regulator [Aeromicrobium sp. CTD01-1L150]|uniref:MurR/RpiR family transcriptional regulator n=1 Tax=Aeromicrobium sp. CTD01-1L150 TaxID=3341830 RepID=UPI0035C2632D